MYYKLVKRDVSVMYTVHCRGACGSFAFITLYTNLHISDTLMLMLHLHVHIWI